MLGWRVIKNPQNYSKPVTSDFHFSIEPNIHNFDGARKRLMWIDMIVTLQAVMLRNRWIMTVLWQVDLEVAHITKFMEDFFLGILKGFILPFSLHLPCAISFLEFNYATLVHMPLPFEISILRFAVDGVESPENSLASAWENYQQKTV